MKHRTKIYKKDIENIIWLLEEQRDYNEVGSSEYKKWDKILLRFNKYFEEMIV
jgi:hypothetical protein